MIPAQTSHLPTMNDFRGRRRSALETWCGSLADRGSDRYFTNRFVVNSESDRCAPYYMFRLASPLARRARPHHGSPLVSGTDEGYG